MPVTHEEAVDAANARYGRHPGRRALHAKGILCAGTFTATPAAAALCGAPHLQGAPAAVVARLSNGAGNPRVPDYAADVRGLAVKIDLPGGGRTDIVCQTVPHFPTSTPDGFVELLRAAQRGPAMAWRFPLFLARHPGALRTLPADLAAMRPLDSYATATYYALHAFGWRAPDGTLRHVRYRFLPEDGDRRLGPRDAKARGRDYLQEDVRRRFDAGRPIRFTLAVTVARPGDPVDDPSAAWPADRETVTAGVLELTGLDTTRERDGDVLVFDPTRIPEGIELPDDAVLRFRPKAYSVSVARRTGVSRPPDRQPGT